MSNTTQHHQQQQQQQAKQQQLTTSPLNNSSVGSNLLSQKVPSLISEDDNGVGSVKGLLGGSQNSGDHANNNSPLSLESLQMSRSNASPPQMIG